MQMAATKKDVHLGELVALHKHCSEWGTQDKEKQRANKVKSRQKYTGRR